jgi:hypothetical protein
MKQPLFISIAVMALISSSSAAYNKVSQGVLRIELEKQFIPKFEVTELEETNDEIEIEDMTYVQLRAKQNKAINKSRQLPTENLVQQS